MERSELDQVQNYLRRLFRNPEIRLSPRAQRPDMAEFYIGSDQQGLVTLDTEDGDRSYNLQINVPETDLQRAAAFLRKILGHPDIKVVARPKKKDSAEVNIGDEFIAVLFLEDDGKAFSFQMAILDTDLGEGEMD
ncbi:MAG TPA: DUF3126 family protein [Xanthobacteraceae bacterium]|nr:DUF3126 family protein [Xanthobacteraceae bacterium]